MRSAALSSALALEITPPRTARSEILLRRAEVLADLTHRINVIQRADRWSSLEAAGVLLQHGYQPVWHLPNRGRSIDDIREEIRRARVLGVRHVLCVRGEYKADDEPDTPRIREVVRCIRDLHPAARVGVTLNPHGRLDRALANLWPKLDAGASWVQMQLTLDAQSLRPAAEALMRRRPDVGLSPMLLPVLSAQAALRVSRRLDIPLPASLPRALEAGGASAGWAWLRSQLTRLTECRLYAGLALMTPMDPSPDFRAALVRTLRNAL